MKNADMPAMPLTGDAYTDLNGSNTTTGRYEDGMGLTKREMIAMHAMQGMLTSRFVADFNGKGSPDENDALCKRAVQYADTLLAELDK